MRYLIRRGTAGWMVWDRDRRGPAKFSGRQFTGLSETEAKALERCLNLHQPESSPGRRTRKTAAEIESMIRAELGRADVDITFSVWGMGHSWSVVCHSTDPASADYCARSLAAAERLKLMFDLAG
jgi:hypothetical protein